MKDFVRSLKIKPAGIRKNVQHEDKYHKLKIVGFAFLMAGVGTTYQSYFNGLVYRSGIYQKRALADLESFEDFVDGENPATLWNKKNELDVLEGKPFKELKYMHTTNGDFNRNYATQTFWTDGDYTDIVSQVVPFGIGQVFPGEKPFKTKTGGVSTGKGYQKDGSEEEWMDSTWNKAVKKVERNTLSGGNGNADFTYQVLPTTGLTATEIPG